jgi:lambda family phage portal protein
MNFDKFRRELARRVAKMIAPPLRRMYAAARHSRLTAGWAATQSSADNELYLSLDVLRARSRQLCRDNSYARRARQIVVNNVIGSGIGLQASITNNRGRLVENLNEPIENAWRDWCCGDACHTGGQLHFSDIERLALAEIFESGEVFIRKHYAKFGDSKIPLSLEIIEAERVAAQYTVPSAVNPITQGVEHDTFHRPIAYWFRSRYPNEIPRESDTRETLIRVPAAEIIHLRVITRWPQTRGEPWMHTVARRLNDMDGYAEAEIVAARASASYMGFIKAPEAPNEDVKENGQRQISLEPGTIEYLAPGEEFQGFTPGRPNTGIDPFMRLMLREVAAGLGVSYESLSRDYSQSNYSSSRLALLDDRDIWRHLQAWFIRSFRAPLHREWLGLAVMAGAVPGINQDAYFARRTYYEAVQFKPRGWSWVDPTKEVEAYKQAVLSGFCTVADVIAATNGGADIEDVLNARRRELDMMDDLDLYFDTEAIEPPDPATAPAPGNAAPAATATDATAEDGAIDPAEAADSGD